MPVVRKGDCRNITTPGATMTTFASPTLGAAASALWRVDMTPGSQGPSHTIDSEQIWTIIDGCATFEVADETHRVEAGDTVVIPAAVPRQVHADDAIGCVAVVSGSARATARIGAGQPVVPPWIA